MTVAEILEQAKALSPYERKELAKLIIDTLDTPLDEPQTKTGAEIVAMLHELGPIELVDANIEDPVDWVEAQRQKRRNQIQSYGENK